MFRGGCACAKTAASGVRFTRVVAAYASDSLGGGAISMPPDLLSSLTSTSTAFSSTSTARAAGTSTAWAPSCATMNGDWMMHCQRSSRYVP